MKRKMFKFTLCVTMVVLATVGGSKLYKRTHTSMYCDIIIANVEALAQNDNQSNGYHVHHFTYYNPVTNIETDKCYATSYMGPNGKCASSHNHGAMKCCSVPC